MGTSPDDSATRGAASATAYPDNPVVASVWRGPAVESVHRGAWCLVDSSGTILEESGRVEHAYFARSAVKCLQVLPLLETGAAERFELSEEELALAVSSHSAEPRHVATARGLLSRIGLGEADLGCGPQPPLDPAARAALIESGVDPGRIHNNCSGKHAGFLALTRHLDADPATYLDENSPAQRLVRAAVSSMTDVAPDALGSAIDGCSAPTFRMPLTALALAFARFANPAGLAPDRRAACERVVRAVANHPVLLAGRSKRICTAIVKASSGALFPKIGAEAIYAIGVPGKDRALAVKIDDGGLRGLHAVVVALLRRFGLIEDAGGRALEAYAQRTLRNWDGLEVGRIEVH